MTDWELQDIAVQIVRQQLEKTGCELMSWQSNPAVDPSIWFVGNDGPEWVIVSFVRYPENQASAPKNWRSVAENCSKLSKRGNFASVGFACMETISTGGSFTAAILSFRNTMAWRPFIRLGIQIRESYVPHY